jgi:hypothetical protein
VHPVPTMSTVDGQDFSVKVVRHMERIKAVEKCGCEVESWRCAPGFRCHREQRRSRCEGPYDGVDMDAVERDAHGACALAGPFAADVRAS